MSLVDGTWRTAWKSALDDLELTLEETEHLLRGEQPATSPASGPWTPPVLPGPLPAEMAERARELLARQQDLITRTTQAAGSVRANANLVDRITDTATSHRRTAVYVDVSA